MRKNRFFVRFILPLLVGLLLIGCGKTAQEAPSASSAAQTQEDLVLIETEQEETKAQNEEAEPAQEESAEETAQIDEHGSYTSKEDVALYLHTYGRLPENFMTKKEANELGWSGGSLEDFAPGMCIGGDHFGNYEGLLPKNKKYRECDIDTLGKKSRGPKRIIYSDDGSIYYTDDHYESFEQLY
ncbi:MAG: ribonuclease [Lachnospiraceae bacterium]|nr:ribonuclease [Lachnospiraceae bacterium]